MIKVLIVDDHSLFRRGLRAILGEEKKLQVVGEASSGGEAIGKVDELRPDVVLMDVKMPGLSGLETTRALRQSGFKGGILMLTISEEDDDLFEAIKAGATGYLVKNAEPEELVDAIIHTARGEAVISPVMATKLLGEFNLLTTRKGEVESRSENSLSEREIEVLTLAAKGATNSEIASALFVSENTVKTHMRHILEKLHAKNRSQAIAYALQSQIIPEK